MINIYTKDELNLIKQSGKITANALHEVLPKVKPGVSTLDLDKIVEDSIRRQGAKPSFMMEKGYHWTTCMNINDMVVHGIPTTYKLQEGDRLGIDLGAFYKGFHSDASWSVIVGQSANDEMKNFLNKGKEALKLGIAACSVGHRIGDISQTIQNIIEGAGYSCVRQLIGHGVGYKLHEDPEIPCYLRGKIENTPEIKVGMSLAIEIIYNMGQPQVAYQNDDGWTIVSRDGSPSGLFEHTVIVTERGTEITTL